MHHQLIGTCLLGSLAKLCAKQGPCSLGLKIHQEQWTLNKSKQLRKQTMKYQVLREYITGLPMGVRSWLGERN